MAIANTQAASAQVKGAGPLAVTITLAQGQLCFVAVHYKPTTAAVSTIVTDTGGTLFTLIAKVSNGTTESTELWAAVIGKTAASLTVTLTGTPTALVVNAATYSGALRWATAGSANTLSTSPTTITGSPVVAAASRLVSGHGITGISTVTATTGVVRSQTNTTGGAGGSNESGAVMDSNADGGNVDAGTLSATGAWTAVAAQIHPGGQPLVGALTVSGTTPSVVQTFVITPGAGAVALAGSQPTVNNSGQGSNTNITPSAGSVGVTGLAPSTLQNIFLTPSAGSAAVSGNSPTLNLETKLAPGTGSATVAGNSASLLLSIFLSPAAGSASVTGLTPVISVVQFTLITPSVGSAAVAGQSPSLMLTTFLTPAVGAASVAGAAPALRLNTFLTPAVGSLAVAGATPEMMTEVFDQPDAGAATLTGLPGIVIEINFTQRQPGAGNLGLGGTAPPLGVGLPAVAGSLALSSSTPTVLQTIPITPDAGSLSVTGTTPQFNTQIVPGAGQLDVVGQDVTVVVSTPGSPKPLAGAVSVTGQPAIVSVPTNITPDAGSVVVMGGPLAIVAGIVTGGG